MTGFFEQDNEQSGYINLRTFHLLAEDGLVSNKAACSVGVPKVVMDKSPFQFLQTHNSANELSCSMHVSPSGSGCFGQFCTRHFPV
jgi:hypothetical protein